MSRTAVVITTINHPTDAVAEWARLYPGNTYVVLDSKTPLPYNLDGAYQITWPSLGRDLSNAIGPNRYQRKMLGYLQARADGAEVIIDTDDDNEPLPCVLPLASPPNSLPTVKQSGWLNPLPYFLSDKQRGPIWPRGLPLRCVNNSGGEPWPCQRVNIGVTQYLAQNDPDVDAIWRQIDGRPVTFRSACPVALADGALSPLNSQASVWQRECFPMLYLPCTVNMRVSDILRGYVAQPILWAHGYQVQLAGPLVRQSRNPHDLQKDFADELPLYNWLADKVMPIVMRSIGGTMGESLFSAYKALADAGIVDGIELYTLDWWMRAMA